ncbi:transcriptional regulator [Achromobacter phage tuull]|nr:transcriptional regulator [Achromobacter phage tuull]
MTWSQAMKEAYASADVDEVPIHTLELRHPSFEDENGQPVAIRVYDGYDDVMLGLEADAPLDGGKMVEFKAVRFSMTLPKMEENAVPQLQIVLSNVSREVTKYLEQASQVLEPIAVTMRPYLLSGEITKYLEQASQVLEPIAVTMRPYLLSSPEAPQLDPPIHMTLKKVRVDVFQITGTASLEDVYNWGFPFRKYMPDEWPGLKR